MAARRDGHEVDPQHQLASPGVWPSSSRPERSPVSVAHRGRLGAAEVLVELIAALDAGSRSDVAKVAARLPRPPTRTIRYPLSVDTRTGTAAARRLPSLKPSQKVEIYRRDGYIDRNWSVS